MSYKPNIKFAKGRKTSFRVKTEVNEEFAHDRKIMVENFGRLIVRDAEEMTWKYALPSYDRIEYTYNGDRKTMNMCRHDRDFLDWNSAMNFDRVRLVPTTCYGWNSTDTIAVGYPPRKLDRPDHAYYSFPTLTEVVPVDTSKLLDRKFDAYQRLRADISGTHMNVLRSVIELKDTRQTGKGIVNFITWMRKNSGLLTGRSCREAAKLYLTYQFGIAPTIDDVNRFISEMRSDKIRFIGNPKRLRGKDTIVETSFSIRPNAAAIEEHCSFEGPTTWTVDGWIGSNGASKIYTVDNKPTLPSYWNRGLSRVSFSPIQGKLFARVKTAYSVSRFDSFLKKFSWSCPLAKTAWDLMPWTFLVDWLCDIGELLARLEREMCIAFYRINMDVPWEGVTSSTEICGPVLEYSGTPTLGTRTGSQPIWPYSKTCTARISGWLTDVKRSEYVRQVYLPPEITELIPPIRLDLNAYQLSAGAALIAANWRSPAKRQSNRIPANTKVVDWDKLLKDYNHHWKDF